MTPALALSTVSALFLSGISATTPLWVFTDGFVLTGGVALPLIPMGFGLGIALSAMLIVVQNEVPRKELGSGIGLVRFLQSLGGAVGLSLLTAVQERRSRMGTPTLDSPTGSFSALVASYDDVFLALAILVFLSFVASLFLHGRIPTKTGVPTTV